MHSAATAAAAAAAAREVALLQDGPHRCDPSPGSDQDERRRGGREGERGRRDVDKRARCAQPIALPRTLRNGVAAEAGEKVRADASEAAIDVARQRAERVGARRTAQQRQRGARLVRGHRRRVKRLLHDGHRKVRNGRVHRR